MMLPITRTQLEYAIQTYGFRTDESARLIADLEGSGRIELGGSMLKITNPTDVDAPVLVGLCQQARGGSFGSVGANRIREYLQNNLRLASLRGASRKT